MFALFTFLMTSLLLISLLRVPIQCVKELEYSKRLPCYIFHIFLIYLLQHSVSESILVLFITYLLLTIILLVNCHREVTECSAIHLPNA